MDRDLRIAAYVDGELVAADRAALEAEMAQDSGLAAEVEAQARLRRRLAETYAPVLEAPVPAHLTAMALAANDPGPRLGWWRPAAGLAAGLAIGVLGGRALMPAGPLGAADGRLVARGELARALDTRLAADAGPIRIGLTFRRADGGWCRSFASAAEAMAGVACRDGDRWAVEALAAAEPAPQGGYRTAGVQTPPAVLAAIEGLRAGDAVDAAAERAGRDAGWR